MHDVTHEYGPVGRELVLQIAMGNADRSRTDVEARVRMRLRISVVSVVALTSIAALGIDHASAQQAQPAQTSSADLSMLQAVSVQNADVRSGFEIVPYTAGTVVAGQVSLDLCSGSFPSERLRTGRYQIAIRPKATSRTQDEVASVEAIAYTDAAAAQSAMQELANAARQCPRSSLVPPAVANQPPLFWRFNAPPDKHWKHVPGVARLAFDVRLQDSQGQQYRTQLIYQQRGRLLVALYGTPNTINSVLAPNIKNQTCLVRALAHRLANTPNI
jgi:hypothetical protein